MYIVIYDYVLIITLVIMFGLCIVIRKLLQDTILQKNRILELSKQLQLAEIQTHVPFYSGISLNKLSYENDYWLYTTLQKQIMDTLADTIIDKSVQKDI